MLQDFKKNIQRTIAEGEYAAAIQCLIASLAEDSEYLNLLITRACQSKNLTKQLIGGVISEKEFSQQINIISAAVLTLLDELDESDLRHSAAKGQLQTCLDQLPLKQMGRLHLVNCDRHPQYSAFSSFFRSCENKPFQFYFLLGCPSQKPNSFAERMIYEIIDNVLVDDERAMDFDRAEIPLNSIEKGSGNASKIERVHFKPLPIGLDADKSEKKFRIEFARRLERFGYKNISIEELVESKNIQLPFEYSCFTYEFEASEWDEEVSAFVTWLIGLFRAKQAARPTFLFFFVLNFPGAHRGGAESSMALSEVRKIAGQSPNDCLLLECPKPVGKEELSAWFRKIASHATPNNIEEIIQLFGQELQEKQRWDGLSDLNMADIEDLQESVYFSYIKSSMQSSI